MKYEEYKDSGVLWIGKVPKHWGICRLKNYCSLKARIGWKGLRSEEFEEESYAYLVTGQDFGNSKIDWSKCYQISKKRYNEDPYIQLENGDLLITKDGTIGKIAIVDNLDKPACLNSGVFVLKQTKNKYDTNYLYWALYSTLLKDFNIYTSSGTTILHLYQNVFEEMPLIIPLLVEQQAIAAYLDEKCGEINRTIDVQKKKIDLLNELKQTIITDAVTKGLDPNAPMKDSGVEWIGEIPEHWALVRIKDICKIYGRIGYRGYTEKDLVSEGEGAITLSPSNLQGGKMNYSKCSYLSWKKYYESPEIMIFNNDIVFVKTGSTYGKCAIVENLPMEATINPQSIVFKNIKCNAAFLNYVLFSDVIQIQIENSVVGGTIPTIAQDKINNYKFVLPLLPEQQEIVAYLDDQLLNVDAQITKANRRIELLEELKQSIITEAVTGKIKVC